MTNNTLGRLGIPLLALVLIVGLAGVGSWAASNAGKQAPDIALPTLTGETLRLADYRGQLVVVNFWAPWCPPCRQEMPDLEAFHNKHDDTVVLGLAVNYRSQDNVTNMVDMMNVTYPVAYAGSEVADKFGSFQGLPTTFVVGPEGNVREEHPGLLPAEMMESYRKEILEPETPPSN